jgi:hypothetical protein
MIHRPKKNNEYLLTDITKPICQSHKPNKFSYFQYFNWLNNKLKHRAKQYQCPKCKRWFFKSEI